MITMANVEKKDYKANDRRECKNNKKNGNYNRSKVKYESKYEDRNTTLNRGGKNDASWYASDPALLRDAANIYFSWPAGNKYRNPVDKNSGATNNCGVPGFSILWLSHSVGYVNDPSDALNVASRSLYSYVRHVNSGSKNYDAPDLMLYILAAGEVYSYINFLIRAYGIANWYSNENVAIPDGILRAMCIDPDDLRANKADFAFGINDLINKASRWDVPNNIPYFNRRAWLYTSVYSEGSSLKDQMYLFCPNYFWKYSSTLDAEPVGSLTPVHYWSASPHSIKELIAIGNQLLDAMYASEDFGIMSGDIRHAYGDRLIKLVSMPTNVSVIPAYNIEVLEQIKNATLLGYNNGNTTDISIVQSENKGYLVSKPTLKFTGNKSVANDTVLSAAMKLLPGGTTLTTASKDVDASLIMIDTRLVSYVDNVVETIEPSSGNIVTTGDIHCGTEILKECFMYKFEYVDGNRVLKQTSLTRIMPIEVPNAGTAFTTLSASAFQGLADASKFDFYPCVYIVPFSMTDAISAPRWSSSNEIFDIDNFAYLTTVDIERLHKTALLSLFNVPDTNKVTK